MKLTLIGQEINALTLASADAKTLLCELPKRIIQTVSAEVCFLIPFVGLPTASWGQLDSLQKGQLNQWEEKLRTILWQTGESQSDENGMPINLFATLEKDFALTHWDVCPIAQDQLWGWLILGSSYDLGFNGRLDSSLDTALSLALKTAQLQLELDQKERYKLLQQKITEVIHNSQDLETILHSAIAQTSQSLKVTRGIVLMLRYAEPIFGNRQEITNPNVEVQLLTQWACDSWLESPLTAFSLNNSPLCLKAWQQAPVPLTDQEVNDPDQVYLSEVSHPMSAWLITPLMGTSSGRPESQLVLGFLLLQHDQPRRWQQEEKDVMSWVSTEVSTAIIHNKTLQRVQSLVDERTAQLQRSLDVQAKLYETSRNQVEQLQELNQLKDEFLATISHELNTPLATMKMAIRMLHNQTLPPERQKKYLGILEEEWNREHNLIKDLLTLQKIEDEGTSLQVTAVDIKKLLQDLADEFQSKWEERHLNVRLYLEPVKHSEQRFTIESDGESVRR
ncbi:MAG: histidine kinase dimerization/phospho-acceptor domain-containing protein, partial [Halothece sp. Uz-M2-17]|nr:histidine kinase dimerization/phospho-acceptor domain-containing protein [Halothece sp. Uz-M2-17]